MGAERGGGVNHRRRCTKSGLIGNEGSVAPTLFELLQPLHLLRSAMVSPRRHLSSIARSTRSAARWAASHRQRTKGYSQWTAKIQAGLSKSGRLRSTRSRSPPRFVRRPAAVSIRAHFSRFARLIS